MQEKEKVQYLQEATRRVIVESIKRKCGMFCLLVGGQTLFLNHLSNLSIKEVEKEKIIF